MNYPNITLKIENYIPTLFYIPEEGEEKIINTQKEDLCAIVNNLGNRLDLVEFCENNKGEELCIDLLNLAQEGDERMSEELPKLDPKNKELNIEKNIENKLSKLEGEREEIPAEANVEVEKEMRKYQNLDIFASIMDTIYNILIANMVLNASELGIGNFYLDDKSNMVRLQNKMASELTKMDIELKFVE